VTVERHGSSVFPCLVDVDRSRRWPILVRHLRLDAASILWATHSKVSSASSAWLGSGERSPRRGSAHELVCEHAHGGADHWTDQLDPEAAPSAGHEGWSEGARRVHRSAGDRATEQRVESHRCIDSNRGGGSHCARSSSLNPASVSRPRPSCLRAARRRPPNEGRRRWTRDPPGRPRRRVRSSRLSGAMRMLVSSYETAGVSLICDRWASRSCGVQPLASERSSAQLVVLLRSCSA
jgi:hypothetical protein